MQDCNSVAPLDIAPDCMDADMSLELMPKDANMLEEFA